MEARKKTRDGKRNQDRQGKESDKARTGKKAGIGKKPGQIAVETARGKDKQNDMV